MEMLREQMTAATALLTMQEKLEQLHGNLPQLQLPNKKSVAQLYMVFDALKDSAEGVLKAARRCRENMATRLLQAMADDELTCMETAGARFTPGVNGYFNVPSRKKNPEEHAVFLAWMQEDSEGQVFLRETIDKKAFNSWCQERMENGFPLPPHVGHHAEPTVRMKSSRR